MCVSEDIASVFDKTKPVHVNPNMIEQETAFMDEYNGEYHWLWASGTSTVLDKEYVLDMMLWRWFEIDRTSGQRLQIGIAVNDTLGNHFTYGVDDAGYMSQLETGYSFLDESITSIIRFGAIVPISDDIMSYTVITRVNLIAVAKQTDPDCTITHLADTSTGAGTSYTLSMADATHEIANTVETINSAKAIFHVFELSASSKVEQKCLEPLFLAMYYQKYKDHTH
jgi:hypothetical protein